ncbi:MAG: hypothetical protein VW776_09650, partial [Betaproteobacteria bacterium]
SDLVTLTFSDSDLVSIAVKDADFAAAITNTGALVAENGSIIMKASVAQSWVDELITKDVGSAELVSVNGVPQLVNVAGRARAKQYALDAGNVGGLGLYGSVVAIEDNDIGGRIEATGREVRVYSGAILDATGASGGGEILIGGDWQGRGTVRQAVFATVEEGAVVDVSATDGGNGGQIVVWSNIRDASSQTYANGTLYALGGSNGGDGGRIETSGHYLNVDNITVSAGAENG